jgi:sugar lactone lactonase YvrE
MAVGTDGTVYPITGWEESGKNAQLIKDGKPTINPAFTNGWGYYGGDAVAINSKYVFYAQNMKFIGVEDTSSWPPKGKYWVGLTRRLRSNPEQGAPFDGAKGGREGTQPMFLLVQELDWEGREGSLAGIAADDRRLYISDPFSGKVGIYDAETMKFIKSFPLPRPGKTVLDQQNTLWIVQQADSSNPARILRFSTDGVLLPARITDVVRPTALAIDNQGQLMVAEDGPRQQILFYRISESPTLVKAFGERGGIYTGVRGRMGATRLNAPNAVGMDAKGNLYVNNGASGTDLRKFSPAGELLWRVLGVIFLDTGAADPKTDVQDVYTVRDRFRLDYSKSKGQEWSWVSHSLDRFRNPNDPRLSEAWLKLAPAVHSVRWIAGAKFLFITDQPGSTLQIYKFDGEIAKPSVIFGPHPIRGWVSTQPARGRYIWRDKNGDGEFQAGEFDGDGQSDEYAVGWDVDSQGNIWHSREFWPDVIGDPVEPIRQFPFQGLDAHGNPIYSYGSIIAFPAPSPFQVVTRLKYFAESDVLYLSGYTREQPGGEPLRLRVGTAMARYDNWSKGNREPRWSVALPYEPTTHKVINAIDVAGKRIFAGFLAGGAQDQETIRVYDTETGFQLGSLRPGPEIGGRANWIDMAYGLRAFQRSNGEYVVFAEDVYYGKTIIYRGPMTPGAN